MHVGFIESNYSIILSFFVSNITYLHIDYLINTDSIKKYNILNFDENFYFLIPFASTSSDQITFFSSSFLFTSIPSSF